MVTEQRFGAGPLMRPLAHHPEAPASATALAGAMRVAYMVAQTEARMFGVQTYVDQHFTQDTFDRVVNDNDWSSVARWRKRLPPHARIVGANCHFTLHAPAGGGAVVFHRMVLTDGTATVTGPTRRDDLESSSASISGVVSIYDYGVHRVGVSCSTSGLDLITTNNVIECRIDAYAVGADGFSIEAVESERASNTVTAEVGGAHRITTGDSIYTEGFQDNVPVGSPVSVSGVSGRSISWVLAGTDDANFGRGTIYLASGTALPYRPASYSAWWEV